MVVWPVRLFNIRYDIGVVPMDCLDACIVPMYKGKRHKYE